MFAYNKNGSISTFLFKYLKSEFNCKSYRWVSVLILAFFISGCSLIDDVLNIDPPDDGTGGAEPGKIKFVAMGDTGTGGQGQFQVAQAVKNKCDKDGCDFVLLLGDNIYNDGVNSVDDEQFHTKFEMPYKDIELPFYVVLGNHDYGGNGAGYDITKSVYQVQYTEKSTKWRMPRHYYTIAKENVTLFALDTNAQLFGVDEDQHKDVPQWIANAETPWKIAFGHHPYKSNGPHGNAGKYDGISGVPIVSGDDVKKFAKSVWCGKVDLYISGHDHSRQWLDTTCDGTQLAVSGAGASTTELPGGNPSLFQKNTLGFLYVVVEKDKLTAAFLDGQGDVEFSHTIEK